MEARFETVYGLMKRLALFHHERKGGRKTQTNEHENLLSLIRKL
jgi:hypothetical protein